MLRKTLTLIAVVFALGIFTTRGNAQTVSNSNIAMSLTIVASLSCTKTQDIAFGSFPSSTLEARTSLTNFGQVVCSTDPGNMVNISFTLPANLVGSAGSIPLSYGAASGEALDGGSPTTFNPFTGLTSYVVSSGSLTLNVGRGSATGNQIIADMGGRAPGTYTATVVATVAIP